MRVLVKEGEAVLADLSFEDEEITIGSDSGCGIHLPDTRVSTRNAVIYPHDNGDWSIDSLDAENPILINGHKLTERFTLHHGDEITIQDFLLKIYLDQELDRHVVEDTRLTPEELARIKEFPLPAGSVVKRYFDPVTLTQDQLERVSRIGLEVFQCRDIHELVDVTLNLLLVQFNARVAWIGLRRQPKGELEVLAGKLPTGQPCPTTSVVELLQYRCTERGQHICIRKVRDQGEIGSAIGVPLTSPNGPLGMLYVDRRIKTKRFQIPDLDLMSALAAQVAAKLDALVQGQLQRHAEVTATEISVVHTIQAQLDPRHTPNFENMQLAAYSRSGQERPGDMYDVMKHPDTRTTAFLVGHVNATGALLALSLARLHATFRVAVLHSDPPHAFARELNWLMYDERDPSTVDALYLLVDPPTGKIRYCRAGKIGALIVNTRGEPRPLQAADSPSIGQIRDFKYIFHEECLAPGETLALYTRGVATCCNAQGERFSERRFIELVCDGFGQPPSQTIQDITYELTSFFEGGKHPDDITIVLLHRTEE
ncbi:MAG TPA: SpoIIE family protein phosphatase [Phycisphaerae bacterium]|nr:SpoIIE family protein phosphatase [Phycisphaerae bacterium]HOB76539.1 SpoIIE family protein phosphatase [Phycisphaerae bacterium]HOJ56566.1 SpoIIE family protein phosphatase [Phycisphaerae bacterium]HOL28356.1 SpoIIE family protein phosphatase [Phycisphaerae bacterium]HPP19942.1 SpoIIE family protein phosphatase [Phycisphaerae bacterium]